MKRARKTDPIIRKQQILDAAVRLAYGCGHKEITRDRVAFVAQVSGPLVAKYFKTIAKLKTLVLREAIRLEILPILAHCVADKQLLKYPHLRRDVLEYISSQG